MAQSQSSAANGKSCMLYIPGNNLEMEDILVAGTHLEC